ncbi:MAG TPA: hypothetical protein VNU03_25905 [Methylomirabilota bacterium]|nr:hypothetical protein [Methylomirabilota bacterium]
MKIAFLASRKGYLKVMGSLIQAALDHGHEALLLTDPGERKPGEATTAEDLAHWPRARVLPIQRGASLAPPLAREGAEALVGPSLHFVLSSIGSEEDIRAVRAAGVRLYSVDYIVEALNSRPEAYRLLDRTFYTSEYERSWHWHGSPFKEDFAALGQSLRSARSAISGSTMLDQLGLVDRGAVRRHLGIGPDKPVVLFMSLKMAVPEPRRRFLWGDGSALTRTARAVVHGNAGLVPEIWKGNGYRALAHAVRRFCDRAGAALVVKSREKNRDPRFLRNVADVFVERDDEVFPYTSIQLMGVADLCIHFQSGAVLEAAMAGVPSISIRVPLSDDQQKYPAHTFAFDVERGSLSNFPGVAWFTSPEGAVALLEGRTLADFRLDPAARRAYVERYLGFDDLGSSRRVLQVIEDDARVSSASRGAAPPA